MPKKKNPVSQEEQSKRFIETARALEEDGGLSPSEAEEVFERALEKITITSGKPPNK